MGGDVIRSYWLLAAIALVCPVAASDGLLAEVTVEYRAGLSSAILTCPHDPNHPDDQCLIDGNGPGDALHRDHVDCDDAGERINGACFYLDSPRVRRVEIAIAGQDEQGVPVNPVPAEAYFMQSVEPFLFFCGEGSLLVPEWEPTMTLRIRLNDPVAEAVHPCAMNGFWGPNWPDDEVHPEEVSLPITTRGTIMVRMFG